MISPAQRGLLKAAQKSAGLADADYRDAITQVTGMEDCRSSTDRRLTDEHLDALMSYFEAIFWRSGRPATAVFRAPGYWAGRNQRGNTSRDRFSQKHLQDEIFALEDRMQRLGFSSAYCQAIEKRIQPFSLVHYRAALLRTVAAKEKRKHAVAS